MTGSTLRSLHAQWRKRPGYRQAYNTLEPEFEKLRRLRAELDKGIRSLDAGEGKELDVEQFLSEARSRHGRS